MSFMHPCQFLRRLGTKSVLDSNLFRPAYGLKDELPAEAWLPSTSGPSHILQNACDKPFSLCAELCLQLQDAARRHEGRVPELYINVRLGIKVHWENGAQQRVRRRLASLAARAAKRVQGALGKLYSWGPFGQ